ncbi:uncharacterized protein PG998_008162 [Apiospora kogelbergensis]|uniref:uncharacterized protein n=1 Tax=Apiospora kogelbergensis TaxID=1337665 RepID=UPI00313077C4
MVLRLVAGHNVVGAPHLSARIAVVGREEGYGEVIVDSTRALDDGRLRVARLGLAATTGPINRGPGLAAAALGATVKGELEGDGLS